MNKRERILAASRRDADPTFRRTEKTPTAGVIRVLAEELDAPWDPCAKHNLVCNAIKPHEARVDLSEQNLFALRLMLTHAGDEQP